jgi:protein-S-isoprenylcysteine O-methyltransferase Ste14
MPWIVERTNSHLTRKALVGLAELVLVMGVVVLAPAGTLRWPAAWVFLGVFFVSSLAITLYLMKEDPNLLERRVQAGPLAEKETSQKIIQLLASLSFLSTIIVPALDHRFGWSRMPPAVAAIGNALIAVGFFVVFLVFRENTFTSATIEVADEQRVIDTGPYAIVRHPMYAGALLLLAGIPLALGSYWGLLTIVPMCATLVWRLLDEEAFLAERLPGYDAYRRKVRFRLVPGIW